MFKLNSNKLILDKALAQTSTTTILPYQKDQDDNRWVVKQVSAKNFDLFCQAMHEVMLNFNCDHPSVLSVTGYYVEVLKPRGCKVYIKQPRMQGNLSTLIDKYTNQSAKLLTVEKIVKILDDLVSGLQYLHRKRIAHTNIKPSNILIDKDGDIVKLADAGSAKGESTAYTAPEMMAGVTNKKKNEFYQADVWGLGMAIAELALLKTGLVPATASAQEKGQAIKQIVANIEKKYNNKSLASIIEGMLCIDPRQRTTLAGVKSSLDEIHKIEKPQNHTQPLKHWNLCKNSFKFQQKKTPTVNPSETTNSSSEVKPANQEVHDFIKSIDEKTKDMKADGVQDLHLDMSEANHITDDEALKRIVNYVGQNCQGLQQLVLDLNDCHKVTDDGVQQLAMSMDQNLTDLQNLTLKFGAKSWESNSFGNITNKGVEYFFNNVSGNLKNLQQLNLSFSKCIELNDDGLKTLGTNISQAMDKLQNLQLEFESCDRISNKGLKYLADAFEQGPKSLQQLNLCFTWCTNISDEGVKQLCASIAKNLSNLQRLTLSFPTCQFVSKKLRNSLKESLESIPVVKIN